MKENFILTIESLHLSGNGTQENVHELPPEKLKNRDVVFIDIARDKVNSKVSNARLNDNMAFKIIVRNTLLVLREVIN